MSETLEQDCIIAEFDKEVENRCALIRSNAENISANLQSALDLTLLAIPECVRKMPVKALMENFNGDIQKAAAYFVPRGTQKKKTPSVQAKTTKTKKEVPTPPSKSPIPRAKPATRQGTAPGHSRAAVPPPAPASARSPSKKRTTPMSSRTTKSPRK